MSVESPYLSVVVTSRNDAHGGDPLVRLQAFLENFSAQCLRTGLPAEVVVVEWNPPADKPRLKDTLQLPQPCFFDLRFIEVPDSLHGSLRHADRLPLFQMIAKNVGIRRTRGRFVLATNIDIIFSDALVDRFAQHQLEAGVMYRVNRHDVESAFPLCDSLSNRMKWCREHQIRVNYRSGTFPVESDGRLRSFSNDIVEHPAIRLGAGWHVAETGSNRKTYRWASERVELFIGDVAESTPHVLSLEIESQPHLRNSWVELAFCDRSGRELQRVTVRGRQTVSIPHVPRGPLAVAVVDGPDHRDKLPPFEVRAGLVYQVWSVRLDTATPGANPSVTGNGSTIPIEGDVPVPLERLRAASAATIVTENFDNSLTLVSRCQGWTYVAEWMIVAPATGSYVFTLTCFSEDQTEFQWGVLSGARDKWLSTSAVGTGPTKDPRALEVTVDLAHGRTFWLVLSARSPNEERSTVRVLRMWARGPLADVLAVSVTPGPNASTGVRFRTWATSVREGSSRWDDRFFHRVSGGLLRALFDRLVKNSWHVSALVDRQKELEKQNNSLASRCNELEEKVVRLEVFEQHDLFLKKYRPQNLHLNACGDFQLMAREHWFELCGYPELTAYSMNIDSLFEYIACSAGIVESVLDDTQCIYHLEHEKGSGWTPEGELELRRRIDNSGIPWIDWTPVVTWATYMLWLGQPLVFNLSNWGFGSWSLPESALEAERPHVHDVLEPHGVRTHSIL